MPANDTPSYLDRILSHKPGEPDPLDELAAEYATEPVHPEQDVLNQWAEELGHLVARRITDTLNDPAAALADPAAELRRERERDLHWYLTHAGQSPEGST